MRRGDIVWAHLGPIHGKEQAGQKPVVIFQNDILNEQTTVIIPFTSNLKQASRHTCLLVKKRDSKLSEDSVALCHQIRVMDNRRLLNKAGKLSPPTLSKLEEKVKFTLGI